MKLTWTAEKRFSVKRVPLSCADMVVASADSGTTTFSSETAANESRLSVTHFALVSVCNEPQRLSLVGNWQRGCTARARAAAAAVVLAQVWAQECTNVSWTVNLCLVSGSSRSANQWAISSSR